MARHVPQYGVFIIESMDWENEANGKLTGFALKTILDLSDIPNSYIYIRTYQEFEHAMLLFGQSDFGFLHISCHGSTEGLALTMDNIPLEELGEVMGPYLKYRRLFLSSCNVACFQFAEYFIPRHHCYSVMGPSHTIDNDKAAIFWSSYYYVMYQGDQNRMWQQNIIQTLKDVTRTFRQSLNYFSIIRESYPGANRKLKQFKIHNGELSAEVLDTRFENLYWAEALANPDTRQLGLDETPSAIS